MKITFEKDAWEEYVDWLTENKQTHKKINDLIKIIMRTPYEGAGQPEALKHQLTGYWSRRITSEHRLVYKVIEDEDKEPTEVIMVAFRYHYE